MNYGFEREGGFINGQPSLAECLTCLTPVGDAFRSSSIKSSTLSPATLLPPPFEQTVPSRSPSSQPGHHIQPQQPLGGCNPPPAAASTLQQVKVWFQSRRMKHNRQTQWKENRDTEETYNICSDDGPEDDLLPVGMNIFGALSENERCCHRNTSNLQQPLNGHNGEARDSSVHTGLAWEAGMRSPCGLFVLFLANCITISINPVAFINGKL
ncbi:hypothetical protein CRUP_004410 [Coryphaenoides rupestris]|nr:hypothetical protein CRUP_004410 [Coryphaenoides rupestris]